DVGMAVVAAIPCFPMRAGPPPNPRDRPLLRPRWRAGMASTLAPTITPDAVISFEINPGTLPQFLETRPEGGPRLKCVEGRVTLVSPGKSHETAGGRLVSLILAVCLELNVKHTWLRSTTWTLPFGAGDTAYEPDDAYYIQSHGTTND